MRLVSSSICVAILVMHSVCTSSEQAQPLQRRTLQGDILHVNRLCPRANVEATCPLGLARMRRLLEGHLPVCHCVLQHLLSLHTDTYATAFARTCELTGLRTWLYRMANCS